LKHFLIDTNVLLDVSMSDAQWFDWSREQLQRCAASGQSFINLVVYAELAPAFISRADLDQWIKQAPISLREIPYAAAWRTGRAFLEYRRAGGPRPSPLPDFFIGAHAEVEGMTVVTRDPQRFRTYFPSVELLTPDTHSAET
jgi:predicted nucleic acid-binding protein